MRDPIPENQQLLQFPCSFPLKIMGRDEPGFRDQVVGIVSTHAGDIGENAVRTMSSSKGSFVSLTITIQAESQQQLDNIYLDLTNCEDVLFAL